MINFNVEVYKNYNDFLEKKLNYNFFIACYASKLHKIWFMSDDEKNETFNNLKMNQIVYCKGKNNNYLIVQKEEDLNIDVFYVYESIPLNESDIKNTFYYPELEDYDLFDYVFDNHFNNFLSTEYGIFQLDWIEKKIFSEINDFQYTYDKKHLYKGFIGSSDPYRWESYLGHRVIKEHGHKLLEKYKKTKIYIKDEFVVME